MIYLPNNSLYPLAEGVITTTIIQSNSFTSKNRDRMTILKSLRRNWSLLRFWGFGFCSIDSNYQRLYFSTRDFVLTLLFNLIYLSVSWYYIFAFFVLKTAKAAIDEDHLKDSQTYSIVSSISFFAEQIANSVLIPMSLTKQRKFTKICNQLNEIDLFLDSRLKRAEEKRDELRTFYIAMVVTIAYFTVTFSFYALASNETFITAYLQCLAMSRPIVSDCMNLQFISIVLVINGRIRRVIELVETGDLSLRRGEGVHRLLLQLGECISEVSSEYSFLFLVQSTRLMIAMDNNLYQLLVFFNTKIMPQYWVLLLFVGNIILYSLAVYIIMITACHRTKTTFNELSRICSRESTLLERPSEMSLHMIQQRAQRHDHGFGLTGFGIVDMDLKGIFQVSE